MLEASTLVSPSEIALPRGTKRSRFHIRPLKKGDDLKIPSIGRQRVKKLADGTVQVTMGRLPSGSGAMPYKGKDEQALAALKPTDYVQSSHRSIQRKAKEIIGDASDASDAYAAAKAIEKWVNGYISKDMSVGYASALETLQTRTGDCTEHAVLTAALCRAAGIPCRIVVGMAYDGNNFKKRFVGHAWNQVYIGGEWIDLDASLGVDASRIILSAGGGDPTSSFGMLQSFARFRI